MRCVLQDPKCQCRSCVYKRLDEAKANLATARGNIGCHYCNTPLNATVLVGIYECPKCLTSFPKTVTVKDLQAQNKVLLKLLEVAKCPACDGSGAIGHEVGYGDDRDVEWEQCQWCYEREQALKEVEG